MGRHIFTPEDILQINEHGLTEKEVHRQLDLFKMSAFYLNLIRPCIKGDGIKVIAQEEIRSLIEPKGLLLSSLTRTVLANNRPGTPALKATSWAA